MSSRSLYTLTLALALAGAWLAPGTAQAQAKPAQLVAAGSEMVFAIRQMGVPVEGQFGKFSAQITLDPKKPETGTVAFSIDTASARFGSAELDAEVPKPTWLNAPKFPQATFTSTGIKGLGGGRFEVMGKLAIKGASKDITVPVQLSQAGASSTASGSFTLKRLDFKVGDGDWTDTSLLANEVQVRFKLQLTGLGPL